MARTNGQAQGHADEPARVVAAPQPLKHEDERRDVQRERHKLVHNHERHRQTHEVVERQHCVRTRVWGASRTLLPVTGCLFRGLSSERGLDHFGLTRKENHLLTKLHEENKEEAVQAPVCLPSLQSSPAGMRIPPG